MGALLPSTGPLAAQTTPPLGPENPRSAMLWLTVAFVDTAGGSLAPGRALVSARLAPGVDASGKRHPVTDSALALLGGRVPPSGTDWTGALLYRAELPLAVADFGRALDLVVPVVGGVSPPRISADWRGIGKLDPDAIALAAGAPLRLRLVASDSTPTPAGAYWSLLLTLAGGDTLTAVGDGLPPNTVVVPANLLPRVRAGRLDARFTGTTWPFAQRPADDTYAIFPTIMTTLAWTVSVPAVASRVAAPGGMR